MSTENTHRDIRDKLREALDLLLTRGKSAGESEWISLSAAVGAINRAVLNVQDAEHAARVEAARGVES